MMNNCAKFHGDSPSGKKTEFNLASVIEVSETADFVYDLETIETLHKRATSVVHFINFPFEFFYCNFTEQDTPSGWCCRAQCETDGQTVQKCKRSVARC